MRNLRKILFPIAVIYDLVTSVRNYFFDKGIFESKSYNLPIIAVGNLSVGGTGKSPMIEYLIRLLKNEYKIATLSRGYRRKSEGYVLGDINSTADDLGDEPMQFHNKFKGISVAVDGNRQRGIAELMKTISPEVILLDDAFQHRKVTAGFYILLTKYNDLYTNDLLLPAGNLRESRRGAKRADIIIVTKCPTDLSIEEKKEIAKRIEAETDQKLFFTTISYDQKVYNVNNNLPLSDIKESITLVTGIANPSPLIGYLKEKGIVFEHLAYKDHHNFSDHEITMLSKRNLILTTEKDYMRLKGRLENVYYLPIQSKFLSDEKSFNQEIHSYIKEERGL